MTGHKITLPAGTRIKDGRLVKGKPKTSVSEAIRQRKSKRVRVQKRTP